jgi:hypothetical protein
MRLGVGGIVYPASACAFTTTIDASLSYVLFAFLFLLFPALARDDFLDVYVFALSTPPEHSAKFHFSLPSSTLSGMENFPEILRDLFLTFLRCFEIF